MHTPDLDDFLVLAASHDFVPVHRRLLSDTLTPVTAFKLLGGDDPDGQSHACLFESVVGGEKVGRYSFLAVDPIRRFSAWGKRVMITENDGEEASSEVADPFATFRQYFNHSVALSDGLPPFIGGAIGYAAYDVVRYVEDLPDVPEDDRGLPDLDFAFYHTVCAFDHVDKTISIVHLADCRKATDEAALRAVYDQSIHRIDETIGKLSKPHSYPVLSVTPDGPTANLDVQSNFTKQQFCDAVRKCVDYIVAGDIFQVVPSQRLSVKTDVDPLEIYRSLRVVNPSPFMFYVRTPECVLVGCSPEIMCRVENRIVTVRPLAGTRRRGVDAAEDRALEKELLADPKERAEHVMLVDLGRNDIGRVAQFGTVDLTEVMVIERYSHVMHISSEVQGRLRDDLDAFDALKACLPAGTVSGAPKVRAMEIIDSIEPHKRGPYGGAVGYIDYRGNMDTCLALRTMVVKDGVAHVQAGCGVVADSDPDSEYEETLNKAKAMIAGIEMAVRRKATS